MEEHIIKDNFIASLNELNKKNSSLNKNAIATLFNSFISSLKQTINKPTDKAINWNNISLKLEYTVETDKSGTEIVFLTNKQHEDKTNEELYIEDIIYKNYIQIFTTITNNSVIIQKKNETRFQVTPEILEPIKDLPVNEQLTRIEDLYKIEPIIIGPFEDKPLIKITFKPLVIEDDKKYYSVILNIDCGISKPANWKEEKKELYWFSIEKYITETVLEREQNQILPITVPIPNLTQIQSYIKTGLHVGLQKFGQNPKKQTSIFDLPLNSDENEVEIIGVDITKAQDQALFAIQKLLYATDYKGNTAGKMMNKEDNSFKFSGYLPVLKITASQYLDAYGVNKKETERSKTEYNSNERTEALKALRELSKKQFLFYYERKSWKDGKESFDVITTVRTLFTIVEGYENINRAERDTLRKSLREKKDPSGSITDQRLEYIVIEPCPILVDQIETYFALKPANFYEEIKLLAGGKTSKAVVLFIDYLLAEYTKRKIASRGKDINWKIEINFINLGYKLRMERLIEKEKKPAKVRAELNKCYEMAKKLGYLLDYKTVQGTTKEVEQLKLNPEKFNKLKYENETIKAFELTSDKN